MLCIKMCCNCANQIDSYSAKKPDTMLSRLKEILNKLWLDKKRNQVHRFRVVSESSQKWTDHKEQKQSKKESYGHEYLESSSIACVVVKLMETTHSYIDHVTFF